MEQHFPIAQSHVCQLRLVKFDSSNMHDGNCNLNIEGIWFTNSEHRLFHDCLHNNYKPGCWNNGILLPDLFLFKISLRFWWLSWTLARVRNFSDCYKCYRNIYNDEKQTFYVEFIVLIKRIFVTSIQSHIQGGNQLVT